MNPAIPSGLIRAQRDDRYTELRGAPQAERSSGQWRIELRCIGG